MAEEAVKDVVAGTEEEVVVDQKPRELSTVEIVAQKIGWNPDYEGANAVDAETFIINSKEINSNLSKKVRSITKEMEAMRQAVDVIAANSANSVKVEVENIQDNIEQLNLEREAAVERGDTETFKKLDSKIKKLTKKIDEKANQPAPQTKSAEYLEWVEENSWYEKDVEMQQWAHRYLDLNPDLKSLDRKKLLDNIAKKAREFYPEKFEKPKPADPNPDPDPAAAPQSKVKVSSVAAPARRTQGAKKKYTFDDLSYAQKKVAEQMYNQLKGTPVAIELDDYANQILQSEEE